MAKKKKKPVTKADAKLGARGKKPANKKRKNTGVTLEQAVARIQRLLDPISIVDHNVTLTDRLGVENQFDVVIRGQVGGRPVLGVIECKDHAVRIGPALVRSFVHKARDVNANIVLMVSKWGFTDQAMKIAKHEGVGTLSLLAPTLGGEGLTIGIMWYAFVYSWENFGLAFQFVGDRAEPTYSDIADVLYNGKPVANILIQDFSQRASMKWY